MASTLPFLYFEGVDLIGPLKLQTFGPLVAIGVFTGAYLMRRWGAKNSLNDDHVRGTIMWCVVCGFLMAHWFDVLTYTPERLETEGWIVMLKFWSGISSYGGFIGGVGGFLIYTWRHKLPMRRYADMAMIGILSGFTFGRLGCTTVHDHIGIKAPEGFFLAVDYSGQNYFPYADGYHHNLGLYEFLYLVLLCGIMYGLTRWKNRRPGMICAIMGTLYAPVRFFLEFLRDAGRDPRHWGLTSAQWSSIALVVLGLALIVYFVVTDEKVPAKADSDNESAKGGKGKGKAAAKTRTKGKSASAAKAGKSDKAQDADSGDAGKSGKSGKRRKRK